MIRQITIDRLIAFVLQGERKWEWAPVLLARVSLGLFFAISGWNKLFVMANQEGLRHALVEGGVPFVEFNVIFVPLVEVFGGLALIFGLLSTFASIVLMFTMFVAIATVEIHTIPAGLSFLTWLDYFLYLPQVLYVILFIWLVISGPGPVSVDYLVARSLKFAKNDGDHGVQSGAPG